MTIAALKALCSRLSWCEPAVLEAVLEPRNELYRYGNARLTSLGPVGPTESSPITS
jgi:hypothetical protein